MSKVESIEAFYQRKFDWMPDHLRSEIGHFNVFSLEPLVGNEAINSTHFSNPVCPVYQNVTAQAVADPADIKNNLIAQLTAPVKWTQSVLQMTADGATHFVEVGPGKVLQGLVKKISPTVEAASC